VKNTGDDIVSAEEEYLFQLEFAQKEQKNVEEQVHEVAYDR
jgi:hypothetical protein